MRTAGVCALLYAVLLYVVQMARALRLPSDLDHDLYCTGCEAVINEMQKKLTKKSSDSLEVRVVDALEDLCEPENFRSYDYIPPKMIKACKYLLEQHDEDLEQLIIRHFRKKGAIQSDLEKAVCREMSHACIGGKSEGESEKKEGKKQQKSEETKNSKDQDQKKSSKKVGKSMVTLNEDNELEFEIGDDAIRARPASEKEEL